LLSQILFTGDEIFRDLPDIYVDTYTFMGLEFCDFLTGIENQNRKKLISALEELYIQKNVRGIRNIDVFIGESPESIKLLHECRYIRTKSINWLLHRFMKYIVALQREKIKYMPWISLNKERIKDMYNRLNYIRKDFIPKATKQLFMQERQKEAPIEDFLYMRASQLVEVAIGSFIIIDKDFSGETIKKLINELLVVFSQVISDVFRPREEIEEDFVQSFEKIVKDWF